MSAQWFKTIASGYRVRIGEEIAGHLPWVQQTKGPNSCTAVIGVCGQVILLPNPTDESLRKIETALADRPLGIEEVNEKWVGYLRCIAARWTASWTFEVAGKRFAFYLPREFEELGILPAEGERVAVAATCGLFEIWKADRWIEHTKMLGGELKELTRAAKAAIELRAD